MWWWGGWEFSTLAVLLVLFTELGGVEVLLLFTTPPYYVFFTKNMYETSLRPIITELRILVTNRPLTTPAKWPSNRLSHHRTA